VSRRPLRTKLAATVTALTLVGLLLAGVITFGAFRSATLRDVDKQLTRSAPTLVRLVELSRGGDLSTRVGQRAGSATVATGSGTIVALLDDGDAVSRAWILGLTGVADPADLVPAVRSATLTRARGLATGRNVLVDAGGYRVLLTPSSVGLVEIAAPLDSVQSGLRRLVLVETVVGLAVIAAVGIGGWLLVRREMRPLERIAATADQIAAGDLSLRVPVESPGSGSPGAGKPGAGTRAAGSGPGAAAPATEVGRVAQAMNGMLDQVESAFAAQRRSEDQLRAFVADASHELRTPLTAIRGYADLFDRGLADRPADLSVAMRRISEESTRMGGLVDDLLLLSRFDAAGRPDLALAIVPVDAAPLVRDAAADAQAAAEAQANDGANPTSPPGSLADTRVIPAPRAIRLSLPDGPVLVRADADRVRQALGNLVRNALVHTPAGSPIELHLSTAPGWANLAVIDRGPGVPAADQQRIFDRFTRLDPGRSRAAGGSGLGLAIVAAIAQAHGGRAWVQDTPGGGATFVLSLPLA
jgi:two-component system OmpR family sensor kinase